MKIFKSVVGGFHGGRETSAETIEVVPSIRYWRRAWASGPRRAPQSSAFSTMIQMMVRHARTAAPGQWNNRPVRATVRILFGVCTFKTSSMAGQERFREPYARCDVHIDKADLRSSTAGIWLGRLNSAFLSGTHQRG